jgi:hypothetical protein
MGATACIVIPWFADRCEKQDSDWRSLAWWIHDHLPYSELCFFPRLAAFNISWHENPKRSIYSYIPPKGYFTKNNFSDDKHTEWYQGFPNLKDAHPR